MKKRILSIFMALCMIGAMLPVAAMGSEEPSAPEAVVTAAEGDGQVDDQTEPQSDEQTEPQSDEQDESQSEPQNDGQTTATTYYLDVQYYGEADDGSPVQNTGGTITGEGDYEADAAVTITVTPNTEGGYCAAQWYSANLGLGTISAVNGKTSHEFEMPANDVTVSITFVKHAYGYHSGNGEGTHDDHCLYCNEVQTESIPCVDVHSGGDNATPNGWCDKCSTGMIYTISFNAGEGTGSMTDVKYTYSDNGYTLPANGFTAPDGKAFVGWAASADGDVISSTTYSIMSDTILYAIWEDHTHSYSSVWLYDESCHWRDCACGGKFETAAHSGPAATATTPQTCTVCGYEIAPALGYTLTLVMGANLSDIEIENLQAGEVVDLSDYWPDTLEYTEGEQTYYFNEFWEHPTGGNIVRSVTISDNLTVYALWITDKQITITFVPNGGNYPYEKVRERCSYLFISDMNRDRIPTRSGYDFVGWSLENDGTADNGDIQLTEDCTLYAVWESNRSGGGGGGGSSRPSDPSINIGGDYDAILRDDVAVIRGDDPISGTLDLTGTNAEAIRFTDDAVRESIAKGDISTIVFSDGTAATMTGSAWAAAEDALRSGESLQIAVTQVDAGALPEELTAPPADDGPYGGSEAAIDKSIFKATGIENIEDRLKTLGLINGNTDTSITEDEFEYLYHYLTTDELTALKNELNESAHFEHHQKAVEWLDEMIERDATVVNLDTRQLNESGIRSKLEEVGYTDGGFTLGLLRQADLNMEQLEYIIDAMEEIIEEVRDSGDENLILAWANEAIAQKELEASYAQMDEWIEGLSVTDYGGEALDDAKLAAESMTTAELERFLESAHEANMMAVSLALGNLISFLEDELEARQAQDAPTYINVGGEKTALVAALEVDVKAVKVSGSTRNIQLKADQSDAFAWSTHVPKLLLDAPEWGEGNVRAYKVMDDGTLEAKAAKVTVNADGTLTLSAMSDGNSTYIFVLEPNPYTDVDETDWYYDAAMTMDQRLLMGGTTETTFGGDTPTSRGMIATILYRMDGSPAVNGVSSFTDVTQKDYFHNAVVWANENGIASGYGDGAFGANDLITREQLATMLWKFAKYQGQDVSVGEDTNILSYNDFTEISEYAIPAVQWACGEGILSGKGEGNLDPQGNAKRSETASMLMRFLEG